MCGCVVSCVVCGYVSRVMSINFLLDTKRLSKKIVRDFFDKLAYDKKFDPIRESHKWYSVGRKDILKYKVYNA